MLKTHTVRAAVTIALLASAAAASYAWSRPEETADDQNKQWEEAAIQLPQAPKPENLLPFYVSATTSYSFAIDSQSLTVGPDGVIRYTLVASSDAGAKNVSYEGIRCESYEKKLYAFGQPDGTWSLSRRDQWERISTHVTNRQHAALVKDYFCLEKTISGKAEEIIKRIRYNKTLAPQNSR